MVVFWVAPDTIIDSITGPLVFRSIGDKPGGNCITCEPTLRQVTLDSRGARLIIASDGLWDAIAAGGKGAAHRVRSMACTKAASNLRSFAKEHRDRDDITVIVADLMPNLEARLPPALAEPPAQHSTSGDCSASLASAGHSIVHKVCSPLSLHVKRAACAPCRCIRHAS